ncbi:MAG: UDP-N-acetylmuramate--L-alanine ligase, partial [Actinobacteria bacterium]|nr:UDP-N-acetylmuramate--L-alanine ligase [Actinomycetota bacterium]
MSKWSGKRLHFIGIGGAGMSGLARIALSHGITVTGSDAKDSSVLSALQTLGAQVWPEHKASQVDGADFIIYSTAIAPTNVELIRASE